MANNPATAFPGKTAGTSAAYPFGEARDISSPGDGTGTPWVAQLVNDIFGWQQALLSAASITPSGSPDEVGASQYSQALVELMLGRALTFDDTGAADAYVLEVQTNQYGINSLFTGMKVTFSAANTNTGGAATADVSDLLGQAPGTTVLNIKKLDGSDPEAGDIAGYTELRYNGTNLIITRGQYNNLFVSNIALIGNDLQQAGGKLEISDNPAYPAIALGISPYTSNGNMLLGGSAGAAVTSNTDRDGDSTINATANRMTFLSGDIFFSSSAATAAGVARSFTNYGKLTNEGYAKFSNTGSFTAGDTAHEFSSNANLFNTIFYANNTGANAIAARFDLPTGATGRFQECQKTGTGVVYYIENDGDVFNSNGTFGTISDGRLKNLIEKVESDRYYENFKKLQFYIYSLLADPTNQKLLGLVAQEVEHIFPGLIKRTPEFKIVKKRKTVEIEVPITVKVLTKKLTVEIIDGKAVQKEIQTETEEQQTKKYPLFDANGKAILDDNGFQMYHFVPEVKKETVVHEYEENEPTGGEVLALKHSVLFLIMATVVQELQKRIR